MFCRSDVNSSKINRKRKALPLAFSSDGGSSQEAMIPDPKRECDEGFCQEVLMIENPKKREKIDNIQDTQDVKEIEDISHNMIVEQCLVLTYAIRIVSHIIPNVFPQSEDILSVRFNPFTKFESLRLILKGVHVTMLHKFDTNTKPSNPPGSPLLVNQITTLTSVGEEWLFLADGSLEMVQFGHPFGPSIMLNVNNLASLSFLGCKFHRMIKDGELHKMLPSMARIHLGSGICIDISPDPFTNVKISSQTTHIFITRHEFCSLYSLACDYRLMFPLARNVLPCTFTHPIANDINDCRICNNASSYQGSD